MAGLLLLLACGGGTEPTVPFTVGLTANARATGVRSTVNGAPRVTCRYDIDAWASGGGTTDYAAWGDAPVEVRLNATGTSELFVLTALDVVTMFGADRIHTGEMLHGQGTETRSGPFRMLIDFRFRLADGTIKNASYVLFCD